MARTAKPGLDVYDEGIFLGNANSIDFAGAGVSGAYDGSIGRATETISGGGGGGTTSVFGEIVAGSATTFTLAHTPSGTIQLAINGQEATLGSDYTITGAVIAPTSSWVAGSLVASYQY